jgi:shikimate kinase
MTTSYLRTRAFEPHQLYTMVGAFDDVCAQLRIARGGSRETQHVASIIFDLAMDGETERARLVTKVLVELSRTQGRPLMTL